MANMHRPWAIVLCRFSDKPPVPRPPQFYVDLFTRNGMGGVCDYWRTVTHNTFDLTGSRVFGWFTMNHASAEVSQLKFPGDRGKLVEWGKEAARANGVDLSPFPNVLVVHNFGVDHGAVGGNDIIIVDQDSRLCEFGFICHEMGHGFGLPHSWSANPDRKYGDGWDLMSCATTTYQFPMTFQGAKGDATVGLNAHNLERLGAIPHGRTWTPSSPDFSASVTLDPLNQPLIGNHGYLVVKIPPKATRPARPVESTFTVEFRQKAGWDQAIPGNALLIHEVRPDGNSFLQPQQPRVGQQFVTPRPEVFVRLESMQSAPPTATLRIWDLPDGSLRRDESRPEVYLIRNRTKCWIPTPEVLQAIGKTWADVRVVPDGALAGVPKGPDVRPGVLTVSVIPRSIPLNQPVSVTVRAADMVTGASIQGEVKINGTTVGTTGTPFVHTFRVTRVRIPDTDPPQWELKYPVGLVRAVGYPDTPINFGFPDL